MNEICFVWGPPLAGQWRWMSRASEQADKGIKTTLIPLENYGSNNELELQLQKTDKIRSRLPEGQTHHIYCELPWTLTYDDTSVEAWISQNKDLLTIAGGAESAAWNLSFLALCPIDSERLPESYRRGLEEFGRASQSSVIVLTPEGNKDLPAWLGGELLDFGPRIEVFEENLWPGKGLRDARRHDFADVEEFDVLTLPLHGEREFYRSLMDEIADGQHGAIWGAEASWKNEQGEFEALTLTQGNLYSWKSRHPSLLDSCSVNGAYLNVAGAPLKREDLLNALKSQNFC